MCTTSTQRQRGLWHLRNDNFEEKAMRWVILAALLSLSAGSALAHGPKILPLGDGKFSTTPKRGYVMPCSHRFPGGGGAHRKGEWVAESTWTREGKPTVEGDVQWPGSSITLSIEGDQRIVRANSLPKHATGEFPIRQDTRAYQYDRNPNSIREQTVLLRLPLNPVLSDEAHCVPMGMIGFALSGVAIFNAFDLQGRDAPAYEIQDKCNGHPERDGRYHYHDWSSCMQDANVKTNQHSPLAGYMLDGIPIYGSRGVGGKVLSNRDLDECHGHKHSVLIDGKLQQRYHYHFTEEFPYTIGCFRAQPLLLAKGNPSAGQ
jgi:hypothetical protein